MFDNLKEIGVGRSMSYSSRNTARNRNNPFYKWHKAKKKARNENINIQILSETEKDYDNLSNIKDELNPILWDSNGEMKEEIRDVLLKITDEFYKYLKIEVPLEGVVVVGSSANYNYTDKSDIDLHLIVDFSKFEGDKDFIRDFFDLKKTYWGMIHDIKIKDHDVEFYVQDISEEPHSGGVFDLKNNEWIKQPKKEKVSIDMSLVRKKVDSLATMIDDLENISDDVERFDQAENVKDKIKKMRQSSLDEGGEFSEGNIAFKVLRNGGYVKKLMDIKNGALDDSLSIDESIEIDEDAINEKAVSEKQRKFFGIVRALQNKEIKPSKLSKKIRKVAKEMDSKEVDKIASTKDSEIDENIEGVEGHKNEYGCLMNYLDIPTWETKILSKIDRADLYDDETKQFGLEYEAHTTILFGFHDGVNVDDVIKEVGEYVKKPIKIEIKNLSCFENEKYDVLKFDVESPELRELNKIIKEKFEHTSTFPDYKPHITVAYLKKNGSAKKYEKKFKDGAIILEGGDFVYSKENGDKIIWNPEDKKIKKVIEFVEDNGKNKITVVGADIKQEKLDYIQDFIGFVCNNLEMKNPVNVFLRNGRDEYIKTSASFAPHNNSNHINVKGRALQDCLRSLAHELTHNRQNELDMIKGNSSSTGSPLELVADMCCGILLKNYTQINGIDEVYDL